MRWLLSWSRGRLYKVQSFSDVRPFNICGFWDKRVFLEEGTKNLRMIIDVVNWTGCIQELVGGEEDDTNVHSCACKGHGKR